MAALLTIEAANTDKLAMYLGECRDLGVPILPPDINSSELAFTVGPEGVRFGLCAVKNVGEGAILSMLGVAQGAGPDRFALRALRARRSAPGQQARAREPDQGRRARFAGRDGRQRRRRAGRGSSPPSTGRSSTAAGISAIARRDSRSCSAAANDDGPAAPVPLPEAPAVDGDPAARVREGGARALHERPSARALRRGAEDVRRAARRASSPPREADIWVGGIVSGLRPLKTKKGDRMAVFMLDDVAGGVEVVVFPETFGKHGSLIETDAMLLVRGKLENDEESARLVATELMPIAALKERTTREVAIHCPCRRTAGRPSRRWRSCSRGIAATAVSSSSWTSRPPRRCASAPTSRSASGRRSGSSPRSSRSAGPERWNCDEERDGSVRVAEDDRGACRIARSRRRSDVPGSPDLRQSTQDRHMP